MLTRNEYKPRRSPEGHLVPSDASAAYFVYAQEIKSNHLESALGKKNKHFFWCSKLNFGPPKAGLWSLQLFWWLMASQRQDTTICFPPHVFTTHLSLAYSESNHSPLQRSLLWVKQSRNTSEIQQEKLIDVSGYEERARRTQKAAIILTVKPKHKPQTHTHSEVLVLPISLTTLWHLIPCRLKCNSNSQNRAFLYFSHLHSLHQHGTGFTGNGSS